MNKPIVSVAVITYNHAKFIRKCLEGIFMQQTTFSFEVVVADDCSTDGTADIVREFQQRYPGQLQAIYQAKNVGGALNAYKYCYPSTRGKYIAVCEGDDVWTDMLKLQKQVEFLEANPDYVMTFHRVNTINEDGQVVHTQASSSPIYYQQNQLFRISINTLSVVFRKCFDKVPEDIFRVRSGDTFLFGLLATYGKGVDLGFIGASYRVHAGGVYSTMEHVEQVRQGIRTRKIMRSSTAFSPKFKFELRREILRRKWIFSRFFFRKHELSNSLKIVFA